MRDHFKVGGNSAISFSGGRTSAYMLWRILQAHGGKLPDDVRVIFANTGKEMEQTLAFIQQCSERWNVPITWVEYRPKVNGEKQFAIVDYYSASRLGEPFDALITDKQYLPNPVTRFCTVELKIRVMHRLIRSWGWTEWDSVIGIRADESRRAAKILNRGSNETPDETPTIPLWHAGITKRDVGLFWQSQGFDLQLPNNNGVTMHGNCDLCFLKGAKQVQSLIAEKPSRAIWWAAQENRIASAGMFKNDGARFRFDRRSYQQMYEAALSQGDFIGHGDAIEEEAMSCFCGD